MEEITADEVFNTTITTAPAVSSSISSQDRKAIEDMGPLMRVAIWALVAVSGLFLALRIYCKFLKHRGLWWDDHILVAAWLALAADAAVNTFNLSLGFGMHNSDINPENLPTIGLLTNISTSVVILGAVWSKTSFGMTLLRITEGGTKAGVWFIIVTMNLAMSISVLVTWIQCNPIPKGWDHSINGICWDPKVNAYYGVFAAAYSGLMDVVLALLPWSVIWGLQMRKKEKIGVALAMSMGVFAGCAAFIKSTKIPLVLDGDFTYEGYDLVIWGAAEVAITICAASVPLLRVLVREVRHITQRTGARDGGGRDPEQDDLEKDSASSFHRKSQGVGAGDRSSTVVVTGGPASKDQNFNLDQWKLLHFGSFTGADNGYEKDRIDSNASSNDDMKAIEAGVASGHSRRASSGRILQTHEVTIQFHPATTREKYSSSDNNRNSTIAGADNMV